MKVQEVFDQLRYGELSQLSIGTSAAGDIAEADYPKLLAHVSLGLTSLYKRFHLKENRVVLSLQPDQVRYSITSPYAVTARSRQTVRYLLDTASAPFRDDLLKIEQVFTEGGLELPLNDKAQPYGCTTPATTVLEVALAVVNQDMNLPDEWKTDQLELVYRASHPKIDVENFDLEYTQIELPEAYLEALLLFVASRIHNPIGAATEGQVGNNYFARYEAACQQLEQQNLQIDQGSQYDKLSARGWV